MNQYSTLRKEPAHVSGDGYGMNSFYNLATKPAAILGTLVLCGTVLNRDNFREHLRAAVAAAPASITHLSLLVLSFVAGLRIIQSLFLAKRDYPNLKASFYDIILFFAVSLFTSGIFVNLLESSPDVVLAFYTLCAGIGAINFFTLFKWRIPARSELYDYWVERRIQIVNTAVCVALTGILGYAFYRTVSTSIYTPVWSIAICILLLILNILHSHELSMAQKYHLHNAPDSPDKIIATFRYYFPNLSHLRSDQEISRNLGLDQPSSFKAIKTQRAAPSDYGIIAEEIVREFQYVYSYLFNCQCTDTLKRVVTSLLSCCGGFGPMGGTNYYFIVDRDSSERVGIFRLDAAKRSVIYDLANIVALPCAVLWHFAPIKAIGCILRMQALRRLQGELDAEELRVSYLVIFARHRKNGYATTFLRLLRHAFLFNCTNDVTAERISAYIRGKNMAASGVFGKCGFTAVAPATGESTVTDPLAELSGLGAAVYVESVRIS